MQTTENRIVTVFAKEPVPGRVKTRLTPKYSSGAAARLATAMLADTIEKLAAEQPGRLACMHGSTWTGDGASLLRELGECLAV